MFFLFGLQANIKKGVLSTLKQVIMARFILIIINLILCYENQNCLSLI